MKLNQKFENDQERSRFLAIMCLLLATVLGLSLGFNLLKIFPGTPTHIPSADHGAIMTTLTGLSEKWDWCGQCTEVVDLSCKNK